MVRFLSQAGKSFVRVARAMSISSLLPSNDISLARYHVVLSTTAAVWLAFENFGIPVRKIA